MKTTDLMIGDWVYVSENFIKRYHKVRYIGDDGVIGCLFMNEYGIECKSVPCIDCVQPIFITRAILAKNAFSFDDDGWYVWHDYTHNPTQHFVSVSFHRSGSVRHIEIKTNGCHANYENIRHIHEFQHALRLCGFNDLTENFKI